MTYAGSCHCGAVRFSFASEPITAASVCNCSICRRKGARLSAYLRAEDVRVSGDLGAYLFGDRLVVHHFCPTCGIATFTRIAGLPDDYTGVARVGDYRINLNCVDGLEIDELAIERLDGRSL